MTGKRLFLSLLLLAVAVLPSRPAAAQSLNDLLGGNDSALVPAQTVEPKLTVTLTSEGELTAGSTLTLAIKSELAADAYVYSQNPAFGFIGNTKIAVTEIFGLEAIDEGFVPDHPPKVVYEPAFKHDVEKFPGGVTWQRRYRLAGNVPADQVYLAGTISYQVCDAKLCRKFREEFEVFLDLSSDGTAPQVAATAPMNDGPAEDQAAGPAALLQSISSVSAADSETAAATGDAPLVFDFGEEADAASLPWYLLMAFLGGVVLNVMPCVLPVLAIKMLSFVQQAGESRGRVLALNISYSLGVIGVFLVLASLAVTLQMSWGGLFQLPEFNLVMIAIVFAMGLSLLGVYEIPIPGMIGSAGGHHREGLLGAFVTGIFATLLATPCTGPFMGPALAWSLKQNPAVVYLVWGVMGLGMASPYLIVGLKPSIARSLPQPGMWMVRFKEFAGIILMGATVWLLSGMEEQVFVPILTTLVGIALALWMIGSLYDHASSSNRKWTVRGVALAVAGLVGLFGYDLYEPDAELPWQPFSSAELETHLRAGKPVLVDFTADWCANCKTNEKNALNTVETLDLVRRHEITTLYADYTRENDEIKRWLDLFNAPGVPLTVIFPEGDPQHPIVLRGIFTQSTLLDGLREAVSSDVAAEDRQSARVEQAVAR